MRPKYVLSGEGGIPGILSVLSISTHNKSVWLLKNYTVNTEWWSFFKFEVDDVLNYKTEQIKVLL